jgi:small subunit ribosomal protein S5
MADQQNQTTTPPQSQQRSPRGGRDQGNRGPRVEEPKEFDERIVHIDRVARVVKGGRRFRFRALVVVGDHKGKIGMGIAKGADVTTAVSKAVEVAKRNFMNVHIVNGTVAHEAEVKLGGARIFLKPASQGTGLIAGGVVRVVLEVAGISNVLSKSLGSSNKINTCYATLEALRVMEHPDKWITKRNATKKPSTKADKPAANKPAKKTEAKV